MLIFGFKCVFEQNQFKQIWTHRQNFSKKIFLEHIWGSVKEFSFKDHEKNENYMEIFVKSHYSEDLHKISFKDLLKFIDPNKMFRVVFLQFPHGNW